jgi:hypothetical protein
MSTLKRIAVAAGVVAMLGTSAGHAIAGGPGSASAASASPAFVLPPDYVQLTDDTGAITVAVPNTWTDVSTLPFTDDAGNTIPRITAATDYQVFHDTFDVPGVEYVALPFNADQPALMTQYGLTGGCATTETTPYNDGAFIGLHGVWSDCGQSGVPEWHQLVVAPADNSRTLVLQIQITSQAELPILQNILDSFNTGTGVPPVTTVAGVPTVPLPTAVVPTIPTPTAAVPTIPTPTAVVPTTPTPTAGVPTVPTIPIPTVPVPTVPVPTGVTPTVPLPTAAVPTLPVPTTPGVPTTVGAVPAGFVQLVDDSGVISMIVPATWTDVNTAAFVYDDGGTSAQIIASTNIEQWQSTFSVPGARLIEIQYAADPATLISQIGLEPGSCPTEVVEPFTNGRFSGMIGRWAGCGSSGAVEYDVIVASPADQSLSYILMVQSTGPADQAAIATVIASFGPAAGGVVTTPTVVVPTAVPGTTVPVPPGTSPIPTIPTPATAPGG